MVDSKKEYEIKTEKANIQLAKFEMVSTSPHNARKCILPDISPHSTDHSQPEDEALSVYRDPRREVAAFDRWSQVHVQHI